MTLLIALLFVVVLGAVVFAPAVLYHMSYTDIRKPSTTEWQLVTLEQVVVAASLAVGGRFLHAALARAARASGFLQRVSEDSALTVCLLFSVLLNSVAPLLIAAVVGATDGTMVPRELAASWLFQVMWTCLLVTEGASCLSSAYSYWSAYFWIRRDKYVSVREAAPALESSEFPLAVRYAEVLHMTSLLCGLVACSCASLYTFGAACLLLVYSTYLYFADKYAFLRMSRHCHYASPKLDATVHYLCAVPLAILSLFPLQQLRMERWRLVTPVAFVTNLVCFVAVVWISKYWHLPRRELSDIPYVDVASLAPYNYFNTNAVHVLRTLHFPSVVVPPIYPFAPGKEYLQGGQFADYDDSVRLRETLMLLTRNSLRGAEDFGNPQDFG